MIIKRVLLLLCVFCAFGAWNQTDMGYINGSFITVSISEDHIDSSSIESSSQGSDLWPSMRLNNTSFGFKLNKRTDEKINLIPLLDLGVQYDNEFNHRNGLGFLLEALVLPALRCWYIDYLK